MGHINASLVSALIQWSKKFQQDELGFYFTFKVAPVDRARNEIVKFFLSERKNKKTGEIMEPFTHLFFVDSDTLPPPDAIQRLLDMDKDIATGVTPILHYDAEKMVWGTLDNCFTHQDKDDDKAIRTHAIERNTGIKKIWRCGGSCLMIKREVFEKLEKPYFMFEYNEDGTQHTRSEDLRFCDKATEAGFEIWCDTSMVCNHFKDVML